jgi:hypothetical protein
MKSKRQEPSRSVPRVYATPKLMVHGDLKAMTAAKGGSRTESGQPKTRTTGTL